mgnify:FL=1
MKKLSSWILTIFIIMFWAFRVMVAFLYNMAIDFPIKPLDFNVEMILLFVTFIAVLLIIKRKLIGGILYGLINVYYFGTYAYDLATTTKAATMNMENSVNLLVAGIALILAIAILVDLALNQDRHEGKDNRDTYWFYKDKKYDRKLDDRADKNQYRL